MRHLRLLPEASPPENDSQERPLGEMEFQSEPQSEPQTESQRDPVLEERCHQLLRRAGCTSLRIQVIWNSRMRTTAGSACWKSKRLSLNPVLRDISTDEVQRTLLHELAHFLAQHRAGRRRIPPHGAEWKEACADLGIPGESRCHNLPLPRSKRTAKYFYVCPHCGQSLERVRAPQRAVACLKCCKAFNHGRYHERFRFVRVAPPNNAAA